MNRPATDTPGIIAPPPALYLASLAGGGLLQFQWPLAIWPSSALVQWVGLALAGLGMALVTWSFFTMRRIGTTPNPYKPASSLSTNGPFKLTRNPIYLAMTLMYSGVALGFNAACLLLTLAPLLIVMHWGVILREERYLAQRFGAEYAHYKARVRRWV